MNAKKVLKVMNYVPRWIWYVGSLMAAPPIGPIVVYIAFHALDKLAEEQEEAAWEAADEAMAGGWQERQTRPGNPVSGDGWEVRDADSSPKAARQEARSFNPIDPDAGLDEVLRQGREAMKVIRAANDAIPDPILSAKIDSIEASCEQILSMLSQRPELLPQLRTFLRYYLPTTLKLLDARARLDDAATPKGREVRRRIGNALDEIDRAFKNQVESLEEYRFVDLESEMDVLSQMLREDGLLSEEDERQSQPLGGH